MAIWLKCLNCNWKYQNCYPSCATEFGERFVSLQEKEQEWHCVDYVYVTIGRNVWRGHGSCHMDIERICQLNGTCSRASRDSDMEKKLHSQLNPPYFVPLSVNDYKHLWSMDTCLYFISYHVKSFYFACNVTAKYHSLWLVLQT